jgi:membrane associated rhomboid family serine protease
VCRNCGALIGAGETVCAVCGAQSEAAAPEAASTKSRRPVYDRETLRFARAILTRPAPFTIVFLVANIFVFVLIYLQSGGENSPSFNSALVAYGAKTNALINAGQWWRLVTPIFLHGGVIHLLMNMYGLWVLGPYVERLYGSAKFVFFWVLTGVAGVVASYLTVRPGMRLNMVSRFLFKNADIASVGASGALFGLIGVLFVFGIKFRHELPDGFKRAFGTGMLPTILLNVFIGFTIPVIDNAAHMGGLIAGAALALVVGYKRPGERASVAVFWHVLQAAALLLVVASFTMVAVRFSRQLPKTETDSNALTALGPEAASFSANIDAFSIGESALVKALNENDASDIDEAVKALDNAPQQNDETTAVREEMKALLARAKAFVAQTPRAGQTPTKARALGRQKLMLDTQAWQKKYAQWFKAEAQRLGLKTEDAPAVPPNPPDK